MPLVFLEGTDGLLRWGNVCWVTPWGVSHKFLSYEQSNTILEQSHTSALRMLEFVYK